MTEILIVIMLTTLIVQGIRIDRKINKLEKTLYDYIEYLKKEQRFKDFIASRVKDKF